MIIKPHKLTSIKRLFPISAFAVLLFAAVPSYSKPNAKSHYRTYDSIFTLIHQKSVHANINLVQDDLKSMLKRAERENCRYGKILAYLDLAAYSGTDGNIKDMLHFLQLAQAAIDQNDPPFVHAYHLFVEGSANMLLQNHDIAVDDYQRALQAFLQLKDTAMLTKIYINLSTGYAANKQPELRDKYFALARQLDAPGYRDLLDLKETYNLLWDGQSQKALDRLRQLKHFNRQGPVSQRNCNYWFEYYSDLAAAFYTLGQIDSAYHYACVLTDVATQYGSPFRSSFPYLLKGNLLYEMGHTAEALECYQQCSNLYGDHFTLHKKEAVQGMIKCYKKLRQSDHAIQCYDLLLQIKDSLSQQNLENNISIHKLLEINDRQQEQIELNRTAYRNRLLWITLAAVILVLAFFVLYQRKRLQERMGKLIALENEMQLHLTQNELTKTQMEQAVQQEQIKDFQQQMRAVASTMPKHQRVMLMEGINQLQDAQDKDSWQQFLESFRQQHGDFSERLASTFPNLTDTEFNLCLLLRAGYTNKEAAQVLHLTNDSLKTYRQHLRKKLSIQGGRDALNVFLSNF